MHICACNYINMDMCVCPCVHVYICMCVCIDVLTYISMFYFRLWQTLLDKPNICALCMLYMYKSDTQNFYVQYNWYTYTCTFMYVHLHKYTHIYTHMHILHVHIYIHVYITYTCLSVGFAIFAAFTGSNIYMDVIKFA